MRAVRGAAVAGYDWRMATDGADGSRLVDFRAVPARLPRAIGVLAGFAFAGVVVDGLVRGLTFATMGLWLGIFLLAAVLTTAAMVAMSAIGAADRAGQRGERLGSPDVGLTPRRPRDDG